MTLQDDAAPPPRARSLVRGPQTVAAGLVMLALAGLAIWTLGSLSMGTLRSMGPAMMPKGLAYLAGGCGLLLVAIGLVRHGDPVERFALRGPFFVAAAILAFAVTIRAPDLPGIGPIPGAPYGLAIAGPLCLVIGGFAAADARLKELVIFAVIMTAACIGLFRYLLNQPMPILVIPGVVHI